MKKHKLTPAERQAILLERGPNAPPHELFETRRSTHPEYEGNTDDVVWGLTRPPGAHGYVAPGILDSAWKMLVLPVTDLFRLLTGTGTQSLSVLFGDSKPHGPLLAQADDLMLPAIELLHGNREEVRYVAAVDGHLYTRARTMAWRRSRTTTQLHVGGVSRSPRALACEAYYGRGDGRTVITRDNDALNLRPGNLCWGSMKQLRALRRGEEVTVQGPFTGRSKLARVLSCEPVEYEDGWHFDLEVRATTGI